MKDKIILLDVETNVFQNQEEEHFDVIQIGAYRLNGLNITKKFDKFIQPTKNPILTDFIKDLTRIKQDEVDTAGTFPVVWREFTDFCKPYNIMMSWGYYDWKILKRVCDFYNLPFYFQEHINLKEYYQYMMSVKKGRRGLKSAVEDLGIFYDAENHHNALADVKMIYDVMDYLVKNRIFTTFYKKTYWSTSGEYQVAKSSEPPSVTSDKVRMNPCLLKKRNGYLKKAEKLDEYFGKSHRDEFPES